jgi:hypothetical protein
MSSYPPRMSPCGAIGNYAICSPLCRGDGPATPKSGKPPRSLKSRHTRTWAASRRAIRGVSEPRGDDKKSSDFFCHIPGRLAYPLGIEDQPIGLESPGLFSSASVPRTVPCSSRRVRPLSVASFARTWKEEKHVAVVVEPRAENQDPHRQVECSSVLLGPAFAKSRAALRPADAGVVGRAIYAR